MTLVIIDMQPSFAAAFNRPTINKIKEEIVLAKKKKAAILFVEYYGGGRTHRELTHLTRGYHSVETITKDFDDGGREIFDALVELGFDYKDIRVCGVNADVCVKKTVITLADLLPQSTIKVVDRACYSLYGEFDWDWVDNVKNVRVINSFYSFEEALV